MDIVDSSGWLEYVTDQENAGFFEKPIIHPDKLQTCNAILWTQDEHFKDIEGENYIKKKPGEQAMLCR